MEIDLERDLPSVTIMPSQDLIVQRAQNETPSIHSCSGSAGFTTGSPLH